MGGQIMEEKLIEAGIVFGLMGIAAIVIYIKDNYYETSKR